MRDGRPLNRVKTKALQSSKSDSQPSNEGGRYKILLKMYEYRAQKPLKIELSKFSSSPANLVNFEQFIVHMHKGDKYVLVGDSDGYIIIFKCKAEKGITLEYKTRIYTGSKESIINFSRHHHNVLFV
jgi:hypothetical protein